MKLKKRLGYTFASQCLPGNPCAGPGALCAPRLASRVHVVPMGGSPKWQEVPQGTKTRCLAFKVTLRQPREKSIEAEEEAGVIPQKPVLSWQYLR